MSALRRLWFPFSRGAVAGALALGVNFIIRLGGFVPFPPESAIEAVIKIIPESVQEPAVQRLGDLAGELGLISATILAAVVYGIFGILFEKVYYPRVQTSKELSRYEKFLIYSLFPWLFYGFVIFPATGESFFGVSSTVASGYSFLSFPLILLLVQLIFCAVLAWEYQGQLGVRMARRVSIERMASQPDRPTAEKVSENVERSKIVNRRQFIEKSMIVLGTLALVATSLDRVIPSLASSSGGLPSGTPLGSNAPSIFQDPRISSLLDSEVTSNSSFYRVAIDIIDPVVNASSWSLQLAGLVQNPKSYGLSDIQSLPSVNQYTTFECVSNDVNGNLISNAKWTGLKISDLLQDAGGASSNAQYAVFYSVDGYSVGIPLSKALMDDSILAYKMNDQILPSKHGYPLRAVIPGLYGMMSAKWINKIELVDSVYSGYWQTRGWSNNGTVETLAFIVVPSSGATVSLSQYGGSEILGGVAFAGDRGISKVEVSVDGGVTWQNAQLKPPISNLTWALWAFEWFPSKTGSYNVYARATDGTGTAQTSQTSPTFPNGATGYVMIQLNVAS
jgi:DMSO/TMAO reductase YedYZ molybdopterin-dependent catalytic subunit